MKLGVFWWLLRECQLIDFVTIMIIALMITIINSTKNVFLFFYCHCQDPAQWTITALFRASRSSERSLISRVAREMKMTSPMTGKGEWMNMLRPWCWGGFPTDHMYCYSLNAKGSASNPLHLLGISWIAFALFGIQTPESGNLPAFSF